MSSNCIFCALINKSLPAEIIYEDEHTLAFMDVFPMRPGHVLVIPKRHAQYVYELNDTERNQLFNTANKIAKALRESALAPDALHFNINDGVAAQQTVPHVHLHLLPRKKGDGLRFLGAIVSKPLTLLKKPIITEDIKACAQAIRQALTHD